MKAMRVRCAGVVALGMLMLSASVQADTIFRDTFNDGDAGDGVPIQWTPSVNAPGDYDASSGDYVFTPIAGSADYMCANALDFNLGDTSIRSQGRVSATGGELIVLARNQVPVGTQQYFGGIAYVPGQGGTVLFLGRRDAGPNGAGGPITFFGGFPDLPFDIRQEDAIIQLDAIGNQFSLWAWRPGESMPSEPQLTGEDNTYASGHVRICSGTDNGNASAFRYVHVADMHIPEPSSVALVIAAILGLASRRWRGQRRMGRS